MNYQQNYVVQTFIYSYQFAGSKSSKLNDNVLTPYSKYHSSSRSTCANSRYVFKKTNEIVTMKNIVVCFLACCVISVFSRIAVNENKDVLSNLITKVKPIDKIITNITKNIDNLIDDNLISNIQPETTTVANIIKNVSDDNNTTINDVHTIDNEPSEPKVNEDNGTALILTKYLLEGKYKEARKAARVDPELFLGVESYSGFFTVNETYNSNIFFWYFPVLNKPVNESPWIIWLQGGPGASSLTGLFDELGPFSVFNGTLTPNPYTWLQNHSLVFIDNPVGTGYSFTESEDGFATDMATYAKHLYITLKQLVEVFPELRTAPLYVAGESYAGKYVPALGMEIHKRWGKNAGNINFQGMIIGNAYVDPEMISHLAWPFYYFGLLDKEQLEIVRPLVESFHQDIKNNRSVEAKNKWNSLITVILFLTHQKHAYNFLRDDLPVGRYIQFLKRAEIKRAIHVGDIQFGFVNMTVNTKLAPDFLSSTKPMFERLLDHYRVLAYCGQLDQMLPCVFTSENYRTWKWNGTEEFLNATRFPYIFNNKLSGYHKTGGHFTEVVVRGAGHMVPLDAPAPAQNLVARWTHAQTISRRFGLPEGSFVQEFVRNHSLTHYL